MSYDLACPRAACDHLQLLERYQINFKDFQTLEWTRDTSQNMRAPISSPSQVQLYFKGTLVAPDHPVYGYSCPIDTTRIQTNYAFRKIVFNQPVRDLSSLIEVSYYTRQQFCDKCSGTGRVQDWQVDSNGSIRHIDKERKLGQQATKYILTSVNPFNPGVVCPLRSYYGKKINGSFSDTSVSQSVTSVLATYSTIQNAQRSVQAMDPQEILKSINSVTTTQPTDNPTTLLVSVSISAYGSNEAIPINVALSS
jgi:hypothetical protein